MAAPPSRARARAGRRSPVARVGPIVGPVTGMTLDESARRLGALAWGEQRLFEILGGWVRAAADPGLALALASAARRHAGHALQLVALLPETRDHDPAALVSPPPAGEEAWATAAGAPEPAAGLPVLLREVVPGHLAAVEAWLGDASAVRDGPGARILATVLAENRADQDRLGAFAG